MTGNGVHTQKPKYDYARLIAAAKSESQYEDFSDFISEKIRTCRKDHYDDEAKSFNRKTLAAMIGMNESALTRIINLSQRTRKRDVIIALCFALRLRESEAAQALNLYSMAPLNPMNLRDLVITQALRDGLSVGELNDVLELHKFPQLNVTRNRKDRTDKDEFYRPLKSTEYEEVSVKILPYNLAGEDYERSLHDRYFPAQYDYESEMVIRKKGESGRDLRILLDGNYYLIGYDKDFGNDDARYLYCNDPLKTKYWNLKPCDDPKLLCEIAQLREYVDQRARYVHNACADTRNYGSRLNAVNRQGELVIYGEGFNFERPELCEYFQVELSSTGNAFSVSNASRFMEEYLGREQWMALYGTPFVPAAKTFRSLEEITEQRWRIQFQKLLDSARELLDKIRSRELFLCNARVFIEIDELISDFNLIDAFDCVFPDDSPYEVLPQKDHVMGTDGKPVTTDDLYRAAELGIFTLEELCSVRKKYGSLEGFIQIDALDH